MPHPGRSRFSLARLPFPLRNVLRWALWASIAAAGNTICAPRASAQAETPTRAAPATENPYAARVPASEQTDSARDRGLREALMVVLKRGAGRSDQAFSPILARATQLVQRYGFERDAQTGELFFSAAFDPKGIQSALRGQGLPVFGVEAGVLEYANLLVRNVRSASDYSRVMEGLADLAGVSSVQVMEVRDDHLHLRLVVQGGGEHLSRALRAGGALRAQADGSYSFAGGMP